MKISGIIEGMTILRKYFHGEDGYHVGSQPDLIFVQETDKPVEPADVQRLVELQWFQKTNDDEDFQVAHYKPSEMWWAYI